MLPTITSLTKKAANDGMEQSLEKVMVHATERAVNDVEDLYEKTMDRIMAKHNGHDRRYRDDKGRFTSMKKAASNDTVDAYEKTMDRIMARHNGHDTTTPRPANEPDAYEKTMDRIMMRHNGHDRPEREPANDQRIIHDYWDRVPQATQRPNVLPLEKKMRTLVLRDRLEDEGEGSSGSRILPILKSIDDNVKTISKKLDNDNGVDSLRAREEDLESQQGYGPFSKKNLSRRVQDGLDSDEFDKAMERARALKSFKGDFKTAAILMGVAAVAGVASTALPQQDHRDGSAKQPAGQRSDAPRRQGTPQVEAAPRPDAIPSSNSKTSDNTQIGGNMTDREKAFVKMIMTSEGAPTPDTTFGMRKDGSSNYITPEQMFGGKHLSELTVNQVLEYQAKLTKDTRKKGWKGRKDSSLGTSAVGIGQFTKTTLVQTLKSKEFGYTDKDFETLKLDKDIQAKMIVHILAHKRKLALKDIDSWSDKDLAALGAEWESLDTSKGKISKDELKRRLKKVAGASNNITPSGPIVKSQMSDANWHQDDKKTSDNLLKEIKGVKKGQTKIMSDGSVYQGGNSVTINLAPARAAPAQPPARAPEKKRVPPPRSSMWDSFYKRYFSH